MGSTPSHSRQLSPFGKPAARPAIRRPVIRPGAAASGLPLSLSALPLIGIADIAYTARRLLLRHLPL